MKNVRNKNKPQVVFLVAGARPNFMKVAPILTEMKRVPDRFHPVFIHTGQHYDDEMSKFMLQDLKLPKPDVYLGVGSESHAVQTARIMMEFEKVIIKEVPDLVIVVGDVNSTLACALVASKMCIPMAHVEAGLRSNDRTMPEEINRILTDQISDYLFTTEPIADENLKREGIDEEKIHFVGNVMIDSLMKSIPEIEKSTVLNKMDLAPKDYALITLHRPSNVDRREMLEKLLKVLSRIQKEIRIVFPAHPRTQKRMREFGFSSTGSSDHRLIISNPLGYCDFLSLEMNARFVLTDSGGVQEETTFFRVPCLTLRENTEHLVTVTGGTNTIVGTDPDKIVEESLNILRGNGKKGEIPRLWDGQTAQRIVESIMMEP